MIRALFLLLASALLLTGCASTNSQQQDEYSSIPWNRPESWEGNTGPLSGMMGTR